MASSKRSHRGWGDALVRQLVATGRLAPIGLPQQSAQPIAVSRQREEIALPFTITLLGAPRTKKNSLRRRNVTGDDGVTRLKTIPSAAFLRWQDIVTPQLRRAAGHLAPITSEVWVRALIYRDAAYHGDLNGYQQAIGDVLQRAGVIVNDELIQSWDGTRRRLDRDLPRVEIEILQFVA